MNIRLFKPSFGKEELDSIKDSLDKSWVGLGPKVNQFESEWKKYLGCESAYALNSATAALHLSLAVFKFKPGKKVLVPSMTFSSTASAILYNRLTPVFVDSDPETLNIDLNDLEKKYDNDCVAVMPVHYAGHPAKMDKIFSWARDRDLKIIEDCAHTSGSLYKGKRLGLWGDIGCYSFEEKKLMTTGDGGMICSNDPDILSDIKAMRWVGIDKDNWKTAQSYTQKDTDAMHWYYELNTLGYKYNMNDLAASIGLVQIKKLDNMNQERSNIIKQYMNGLKKTSWVDLLVPFNPDNYVYQMFGIRVDNKNKLITYLKSKGIATGCHYTPLSVQPLFKKWGSNCPFIEKEIDRCITLPLHPDLSKSEVNYIIDQIINYDR